MNKFNIFIALTVIFLTILVIIIKPQSHKQIVVGDYDVALFQQQVKVENFDNTESQSNQNLKPKSRLSLPAQQNKAENMISQKRQEANLPRPLRERVGVRGDNQLKSSNTKPVFENKQIFSDVKPVQVKQKQVLTEEEAEIIAWNAWRSALQNEVMKDSKIRAPVGTVFRFSFTVDKYGTISNLKTWSENPQYTPTAVRVIKPVLLSYQGQSILNFPPKSKRVITNVVGEFMTWYTSDYSTPSDYSDYERVK